MIETSILILFIFSFGLIWGSFLNVVAYRVTFDKPFFTKRSHCPSCNHMITWYDNIPLLSWLLLKGHCRHCKNIISWIYPFIELTTAIIMTALFIKLGGLHHNFTSDPLFIKTLVPSFILFTALIIATATDFHDMVIPQIVTLWLIPIGILCAYTGSTTISTYESMLGAFLGYGVLWLTAFIFKRIMHKDGIGVGDMELLAMIGSFLGLEGAWFSIMIGSITGFIGGGIYLLLRKKNTTTPIPFGPFIALGATIFFFFKELLSPLLMGNM